MNNRRLKEVCTTGLGAEIRREKMRRIRKDLIHVEGVYVTKLYDKTNKTDRMSIMLHKSISEGVYDVILIPKYDNPKYDNPKLLKKLLKNSVEV